MGAGRTIKGPIYSKPEKRRERGHKGKSSSLQLRWPGPSDLLLKRRPSSFAGFDHSTIRPFDLAPFLFLFLATGDSNRPEHPCQRQQIQHVEDSRSAPAGASVAAHGSWWHPVGALPFCAPSAPQCADAAVLQYRTVQILLTSPACPSFAPAPLAGRPRRPCPGAVTAIRLVVCPVGP
jgi:hypothetical protein